MKAHIKNHRRAIKARNERMLAKGLNPSKKADIDRDFREEMQTLNESLFGKPAALFIGGTHAGTDTVLIYKT